MQLILKFLSLSFACILLITGCDKKAAPVPNDSALLSEEVVLQFGKDLEKAVLDRDKERIEQLLSIRNALRQLAVDFGLSHEEAKTLEVVAEQKLNESSLADALLKSTAKGGTYMLIRVHVVDGQQRALFRLLNGNAAYYHDFIVVRQPDGQIAMEDAYIHAAGEMLSQAIRRTLLSYITEVKSKENLTEDDNEFVANLDALMAIDADMARGRFAEVAARYHKLPQRLQENKSVFLHYLSALIRSRVVPEKEFAEAAERFRRLYPNDSALDFITLDALVIKKDFKGALNAVEKVDACLGGDSQLQTLRAYLLIDLERYDEAVQQLDVVLQNEPKFENAYWAQLTASTRRRDHADTFKWIKKISEDLNQEVKNVRTHPTYEHFRNSPEFAEWEQWKSVREL